MKIKISPYPNLNIAKESMIEIQNGAVLKNDSEGLSIDLILIAKFKNGAEKVLKTRPISHFEKKYFSAFPNPIHLFLSSSIEMFELSEKIKQVDFKNCGKKCGKDMYLLDIEEDGTHECYNNYIKYRSSSIIMLVCSIEAFLNHIIPNDFKYERKKTVKGVEKTEHLNKKKIESSAVSFREKLEIVIPLIKEYQGIWKGLKEDKEIIYELYQIRRGLIHLKTNAEDDLTAYFKAIDIMLDFNLNQCIKSSIKMMNYSNKTFVENKK